MCPHSENPRGRQKPAEKRNKKRKEEKRMKMGYTKEVFKKEAREIFKNFQKNKNENIFSKREETFVHTKRFQLKIRRRKTFLVFQKKRKVDQKNIFFLGKVFQKNTIFLFFFFGVEFFYTKK